MPIEVQCKACGTRLRAPDTAAGKTKACPKCGGALPIPATTQPQAPDDDINLYELALDKPEPASSSAAAPDTVIIRKHGTSAKPADAKQSDTAAASTVMPGLGYYAEAIAAEEAKRQRPAARGPLLSVMGIDLTIARLLGLGVVVLALAFVGIWWVTLGPGRTHALISVRPIYLTHVLATGQVIEPYSIVTGEGSLTAGVKGPPGLMGAAAGVTGALPGGDIMTVGRSDRLLVTRDSKDGDHLLLEVELSQALMNRLGQSSRYSVVFKADQFALQPADKSTPPLQPYMLYAVLDAGRADLSIGATKSTDHLAILPPGAPPTTEQLDMYGQRVRGGKMYWNGEAGIRGDLDFRVNLDTSNSGTGGGFFADGNLKITDHGGTVVDMQYTGGGLTISWNAGAEGHWARDRFEKQEGEAPFTKFTVGLVFERPHTDQPLVLSFAGKQIATLGKHHNNPTPRHASQGTNVTTYFSLLAQAREKARGVVAGSNMVQIGYAIQLYADQHRGKMPDRLEDLRAVMPGLDSILENKRTGETPGYVYIKPAPAIDQVQNPATTVILYESKGGHIDPQGAKLYADGHFEPGS